MWARPISPFRTHGTHWPLGLICLCWGLLFIGKRSTDVFFGHAAAAPPEDALDVFLGVGPREPRPRTEETLLSSFIRHLFLSQMITDARLEIVSKMSAVFAELVLTYLITIA